MVEVAVDAAPPTTAENASQVRTELTTELARIDAATSTRLATAGYTAPLDAAGTRTAIGLAAADLDDQLAAIAASSGLTAQQTRDALKLAPSAGAAAAGSVDDLLADMPATILTTVVAPYAGTPGTFGYLLSLLAGLDFTAVNLVTASNAGEITIKRTLTLAAVVSGLTIPADWTACYWTVKRSTDDADADALVQILESNPPDADDGLLILMGAAVEDQTAGSLTVNQTLGTVTIALDDASTAALEDAVELVWDVKVHATGGKTQPGSGTATITTAVTRA